MFRWKQTHTGAKPIHAWFWQTIGCAAAVVFAGSAGAADAAVAGADILTKDQGVVPTGATTTLFAYSEQTVPIPANPQPNFYTRDLTRIPGAKPVTVSPVPLATVPGGGTVNINIGGRGVDPSVSLGPSPKLVVPGSINMLLSKSAPLNAFPTFVEGQASELLGAGNRAGLSTLARASPSNTRGSAAAIAFDPGAANGSPTLTETPYAETLKAQLGLNSSGYSAVEFYALDSRLSGGAGVNSFVDRGQPISEALWSLTMSITAPVTSMAALSNVNIAFTVNPIAVRDGYFTVPVSDATIDADIREALTLKNGVVSLSNFALFPNGTFYDADSNILYALADQSELIQVPEPGTWTLLLLGLGAIGAVKRGRSTPKRQVW